MLEEALCQKAPKMKGVKPKADQVEEKEKEPETPTLTDNMNLKEILDQQPELLKKFMQKNAIDENTKSQLLKHINEVTPHPIYSGIHIKRGQIVGLENIFGSYGREDKDLE